MTGTTRVRPKDFAKRLGFSIPTLYRRMSAGEIKRPAMDGKHFHKIEGQDLNDFVSSFKLLANQFDISPKVRALTLWTERGAMRHAKLLETDRAWEVFEQLEDSYFRIKQSNQIVLPDFTDPAQAAMSGGKGYQTLINAALRDAMQKDSFVETLRAVIRDELKHA